jgi:hypothetical protein
VSPWHLVDVSVIETRLLDLLKDKKELKRLDVFPTMSLLKPIPTKSPPPTPRPQPLGHSQKIVTAIFHLHCVRKKIQEQQSCNTATDITIHR